MRSIRLKLLFVLGCAWLTGCANLDSGSGETWFGFGKDYAHTRANAEETELTPSTVGDLTVQWSQPLGAVTSTPLVANGVVYAADWESSVRAYDARNGQVIWSNDSYVGYLAGASATPFLLDNYLYVPLRNGHVVKLDANDGTEIWKTQVRATEHVHLYSSTAVADGVVVVGVASGGTGTQNPDGNREPTPEDLLVDFRGNVHGLDAETGEILWVLETTIDGAGEVYGPGVSVWSSPTLDLDRKVAYVGTGNAYYAPAGPYSDALLAIDYLTGELVWHVQFTENDDYTVETGGKDWDVGATPNLFTIGDRDVVGVGDKGGWYHVHDRDTGERIWSTDFRADDGSQIVGSTLGGIMVPAAYHDGVLYIAINSGFIGGSYLLAVDAADGTNVFWRAHHPATASIFGSPTYAGGVVYTGDSGYNAVEDVQDDASLLAYDAATGDLLWTEMIPEGRAGGLSVIDGLLYVGRGFNTWCFDCQEVPGGLRAYGLP